jgi:dephospho-CoA kinase
LKFADYVIQNEGSLEETKKRAKEIFKDLKRVALHTKKDTKRLVPCA